MTPPPSSSPQRHAWSFWVDRGGTFTDVVGRGPDGAVVVHKELSDLPDGRDAAVVGIRRVLGLGRDEPVPATLVDEVRMGTTVATNALLERTGTPTVLVTTAGFRDALRIGDQHRPDIFARHIVLPDVLHDRVVEVGARVAVDGTELEPLDEAAVRRDLGAALDAGCRAVAVVLLHGWAHAAHERAVGAIATDLGFEQVSLSHEVSPLMRLVPRGDTTVVDAWLSPGLREHVRRVADQLPGIPVRFMQSNGGLVAAARLHGRDAILSGPAGGVVAAARVAAAAGHDRIIGFDMGGTSTDVSHVADGVLERTLDTEVGGIRVRVPMLAVHTVAAGGGSVLHFDGRRYRVGPDSAGADPGPAAYRNGGPLTVTDANLVLGRIQPAAFPAVFGADRDQPLDPGAALEAFTAMADRIRAATGDDRSPQEVAAGFRAIAVANMANAIRTISVRRGHDVTQYALVTFGGAGGQHACAVADLLGMDTVLVHPLAGVLSAYGMGLADVSSLRDRAVELALDDDALAAIEEISDDLEIAARSDLDADLPAEQIARFVQVRLRHAGSDTSLTVDHDTVAAMRSAFDRAYLAQYSFLPVDAPLVVTSVRVEVTAATGADETEVAAVAGWGGGDPRPSEEPGAEVGADAPDTTDTTTGAVVFDSGSRQVPIMAREHLRAGAIVSGPALVTEATGTTVVDPGWQARVTDLGHLELTRTTPRSPSGAGQQRDVTVADPVLLEVFDNQFMAVAQQMGVSLQRTAHSVNIKERLDFSCAVFDAAGNLIANAPHIPVHLGSMGESIRAIRDATSATIRPGDVYCLNNPYRGGTHLPDITVATPVFAPDGADTWFWVASRGHHAEIGGITPGSMPATSTRIDQEGVVFDTHLLVRDGQLRRDATREALLAGAHPSRDPESNLADLAAQVAANETGVRELRAMVDNWGLDVVHAYMDHVRTNAAEAIRGVIDRLASTPRDGPRHAIHPIDGGAVIEVAIEFDRVARRAHIDFTGTSPQRPGNDNAPVAVTMAAVLYVFRTLVAADIPLNAGCLEPLDVTVPPGCMLNPRHPAAVVAGNVETSQAVTAALYEALGVQAEGAGTMNNVTFGNEEHQYYETVASGSGAAAGFDGTDVVQTHMTNSRLTDPEVVEWRHPVRVSSFRIRRGSGGRGLRHGGDGAERRLLFLEPMTVSVLASNREVAPRGLAGGGPGAPGDQWIEHPDGTTTAVGGRDQVEVDVGDTFVLLTPGGGGWGSGDTSTVADG